MALNLSSLTPVNTSTSQTDTTGFSGINYLLNQFDNFARQNRFTVAFTLPGGIDLSKYETGSIPELANLINKDASAQTIADAGIQKSQSVLNNASRNSINVACRSMQLPNRTIKNVYNYQTNAKHATDYDLDPISFTFLESENLHARRYFEIWQSVIINNKNKTLNFYDEYVANVELVQLDRKGNQKYLCVLQDAYPVSISTSDYSFDSDNSLTTTTISMIFKNYDSVAY